MGNILFTQAEPPCISAATLNYDRVQEYRETFAALQGADGKVE
jgi:hypothetical protein